MRRIFTLVFYIVAFISFSLMGLSRFEAIICAIAFTVIFEIDLVLDKLSDIKDKLNEIKSK